MKLLLKRKYDRYGIRGVLSFEGTPWAKILEAPPDHEGNPGIADGTYRLEWQHEESIGWTMKGYCADQNSFLQIRPGEEAGRLSRQVLAPVTDFRCKGRGTFSKLATMKLIEKIDNKLYEGEEMLLEIFRVADWDEKKEIHPSSWVPASY